MEKKVKSQKPVSRVHSPGSGKAKSNDEISELKKRCQEMEDGWKRTQAEFMNYKNRTEKEKAELADYIRAEVVTTILPVYDNLQRGYTMVEDKAGYEMIIKSFISILKNNFNIVPLACSGDFDASRCEAIGFKDEGGKSGQIAAVVETGFMCGDKIIRPAKVLLYK